MIWRIGYRSVAGSVAVSVPILTRTRKGEEKSGVAITNSQRLLCLRLAV